MIDIAIPGHLNIDSFFLWLSETIYVTRMQLVMAVVSTGVFTWIASRMFNNN